MKISIRSVFLAFMFLTVLLSGCASASTPVPPTPILPTLTPTIKPGSGTFATDLSREASPEYGLIFIIDQDNPDQIAGYMVFCGNAGGLSMPQLEGLSRTNVKINENKFAIDNQNILIQGQITKTDTMEGTIEAKSQEATNCAIPQNGQWIAQCGVPTGLSFLSIGGKSFSEDDLEGSCT